MANKRHKPEEIVTKLRQVEVLVGQGMARAVPVTSAWTGTATMAARMSKMMRRCLTLRLFSQAGLGQAESRNDCISI